MNQSDSVVNHFVSPIFLETNLKYFDFELSGFHPNLFLL